MDDAEADRPALRAIADENLVLAFRRLVQHFGAPGAGTKVFGGATAIVTGMPQAVATTEAARRRGYGRAVTWAAIEAGAAEWGSEVAILQSSEMGFSVYRAMGFLELCRYVIYEEPS